jgi:hypothetical protein
LGDWCPQILRRTTSVVVLRALVVFIESMALLMENSLVEEIFSGQFQLFQIFNLNLQIEDNVWLESAGFLPKAIAFFAGLFLWLLFSIPVLRGIILQLAHCFFFFFILSVFKRFQQCSTCPKLYNTLGIVLAVLILVTPPPMPCSLFSPLSLSFLCLVFFFFFFFFR